MRKSKVSNWVRKIREYTRDIQFWIISFFIIRLIGITNAPLETGHNWRQSLTNMIARNFHEFNANILYPTIDMAGEKTGIIGSEFPLFNYLIYVVSIFFEYDHWYGRLINLIVSSVGVWYFYKGVRLIFTKEIAFNSTIILLASIWFAFSRKIMPDTFSTSMVVIGLYYAAVYLKCGQIKNVILFFVFSTLGILCKIPTLSLFGVLGIIMFIPQIDFKRKLNIFIWGVVSFSVVIMWYFFWVPYLLEQYQYQLYFPKGIIQGIMEIIPLWDLLFERFYFSAFHSYVALIFFLLGIKWLVKAQNRYVNGGLGIVLIIFLVFIIKTGSVFPLHNYYIIPFVPVMAIVAGGAISAYGRKYQFLILLMIVIEGIMNQQHDFFISKEQEYKLSLESVSCENIPLGNLILINGGESPQTMYFSHQKGWTLRNDEIDNVLVVDSLSHLGASYIIIDKKVFPEYQKKYRLIYEDNLFLIEGI